MDNHNQHHARRDYLGGELTRDTLDPDPFRQFGDWLQEVINFGSKDATAMAIATADADGAPSVRTVLLKQHGPEGFTWFTDSRSRKGQELAVNPRGELLFYWRDLDRQVRARGEVIMLPPAAADEYFHSRPEGSKVSAAASEQTSVIAGRSVLEQRVDELRRQHPDGDVPRPPAWLGYRLQPVCFEFWQGRVNRLHDRFRYLLRDSQWQIDRLSP